MPGSINQDSEDSYQYQVFYKISIKILMVNKKLHKCT